MRDLVGEHGIVLKVRDTLAARTSKVSIATAHRAGRTILRFSSGCRCVPVCVAGGDRPGAGPGGRIAPSSDHPHPRRLEAIFWQSPRTTKAARPNVPLPTGRAWRSVRDGGSSTAMSATLHAFKRRSGRGHVETVRRGLPAGDYAVRNSTAGSWSPWNASRWPICPAAR